MDRKSFLKKGILGAAAAGLGVKGANTTAAQSEEHLVGFNHIPNTNSNIMANITAVQQKIKKLEKVQKSKFEVDENFKFLWA